MSGHLTTTKPHSAPHCQQPAHRTALTNCCSTSQCLSPVGHKAELSPGSTVPRHLSPEEPQHCHPRCAAAQLPQLWTLPFPPAVCSIFRWSTVICRISAFSSLADPWGERGGSCGQRASARRAEPCAAACLPASRRRWAPAGAARTGCCWCGRGGASLWSAGHKAGWGAGPGPGVGGAGGTHPSAPLPGQDLRGGWRRRRARGRAQVPAGSAGQRSPRAPPPPSPHLPHAARRPLSPVLVRALLLHLHGLVQLLAVRRAVFEMRPLHGGGARAAAERAAGGARQEDARQEGARRAPRASPRARLPHGVPTPRLLPAAGGPPPAGQSRSENARRRPPPAAATRGLRLPHWPPPGRPRPMAAARLRSAPPLGPAVGKRRRRAPRASPLRGCWGAAVPSPPPPPRPPPHGFPPGRPQGPRQPPLGLCGWRSAPRQLNPPLVPPPILEAERRESSASSVARYRAVPGQEGKPGGRGAAQGERMQQDASTCPLHKPPACLLRYKWERVVWHEPRGGFLTNGFPFALSLSAEAPTWQWVRVVSQLEIRRRAGCCREGATSPCQAPSSGSQPLTSCSGRAAHAVLHVVWHCPQLCTVPLLGGCGSREQLRAGKELQVRSRSPAAACKQLSRAVPMLRFP